MLFTKLKLAPNTVELPPPVPVDDADDADDDAGCASGSTLSSLFAWCCLPVAGTASCSPVPLSMPNVKDSIPARAMSLSIDECLQVLIVSKRLKKLWRRKMVGGWWLVGVFANSS
jgi:hypothetical protein